MENVPPQSSPELQHHLVRFTAIDRKLDAALADLTKELYQIQLPPFLHVFSIKPIDVDPSDMFDGYSVSKHRKEIGRAHV